MVEQQRPGPGRAEQDEGSQGVQPRVEVVDPDGPRPSGSESGNSEADGDRPLAEMVAQPAKVMRIGSMIKQLLEEVREAPLDEASRARLKEIHHASVVELEKGLAPELIEELDRLTLPFVDSEIPTEAELRIAQAQLVGWLEGLFHGIQTALVAQQMAARAQLEQMRKSLPPGASPSSAEGQASDAQPHRGGGMYL